MGPVMLPLPLNTSTSVVVVRIELSQEDRREAPAKHNGTHLGLECHQSTEE